MKALRIAVVWFLFAAGPVSAQTPLRTEFYPLQVGNRWVYRAIDNRPEAADPKQPAETRRYLKVVVKVEQEEIYEQVVGKDDKGNDKIKKYVGYLLNSTSGGKTTLDHVVVMDEGLYRVSTAGVKINPPLLFFKLPLNPGEKWDVNSIIGASPVKGSFSWKTEKVRVPAGEIDTVMITFREGPASDPKVEIDYWFARGIGMVKQRVRSKNHDIILELEQFTPVK